MKYKIDSEKSYRKTMILIYDLMTSGESNLNESDVKRLKAMTISAEKYEDEVLGLV